MRSSSGVWGWVVSGYFCPWARKPHVWVRIASVHIPTHCFVFQCSSKWLQPGQGWHVVVNVSVWLPRVTGHRTVGTHWGGRCWSRPLSWPWRSQRSVGGPAGRWGCSPSAAAPGSNSPTPLWRPGREEEEELRKDVMKHREDTNCQKLDAAYWDIPACTREKLFFQHQKAL